MNGGAKLQSCAVTICYYMLTGHVEHKWEGHRHNLAVEVGWLKPVADKNLIYFPNGPRTLLCTIYNYNNDHNGWY